MRTSANATKPTPGASHQPFNFVVPSFPSGAALRFILVFLTPAKSFLFFDPVDACTDSNSASSSAVNFSERPL